MSEPGNCFTSKALIAAFVELDLLWLRPCNQKSTRGSGGAEQAVVLPGCCHARVHLPRRSHILWHHSVLWASRQGFLWKDLRAKKQRIAASFLSAAFPVLACSFRGEGVRSQMQSCFNETMQATAQSQRWGRARPGPQPLPHGRGCPRPQPALPGGGTHIALNPDTAPGRRKSHDCSIPQAHRLSLEMLTADRTDANGA